MPFPNCRLAGIKLTPRHQLLRFYQKTFIGSWKIDLVRWFMSQALLSTGKSLYIEGTIGVRPVSLVEYNSFSNIVDLHYRFTCRIYIAWRILKATISACNTKRNNDIINILRYHSIPSKRLGNKISSLLQRAIKANGLEKHIFFENCFRGRIL